MWQKTSNHCSLSEVTEYLFSMESPKVGDQRIICCEELRLPLALYCAVGDGDSHDYLMY